MNDKIYNTWIALIPVLILITHSYPAAEARRLTDMAGRQVTVPNEIRKVYATSPPATYMVYAMDPALVAGLNFPLTPSQLTYMDPRMAHIPVAGGWFGQGRTANLESVLKIQPDIILILMWHPSAVNERIERALKPLHIPLIYVTMQNLGDYPAVFRFLGRLFNQRKRAEILAGYAEHTLSEAHRLSAAIDPDKRVSVYYAEGSDGLSTECHTSIHAELIPLSGSNNVHRCRDLSASGMQKISMEQILDYDPDVIVYHEPLFRNRLNDDPRWRSVRAVVNKRVYQIPRTPFNWFDRPPSFMRLMGLQWMIRHLYPQIEIKPLTTETRKFFKIFLNIDLDEAVARKLLQP